MREFAIVAGVAAVGLAAGAWAIARLRTTPEERERRRCEIVNTYGRLIDGTCTDVDGPLITYRYEWRGVEYMSTQDLSSFESLLPDPPDRLIGSVIVKFLPKDPSKSIVCAEGWSGFRR